MKKLALFCLSLLLTLPAVSQNNPIDSLLGVLDDPALTADDRLTTYNRICSVYLGRDMDKCVEYARKGLELATKERNKTRISRFNGWMAATYNLQGKADSAMMFAERALDFGKQAEDRKAEALALGTIGEIHQKKFQLSEAVDYYLKALTIYDELGEKQQVLKYYNNIGSIYLTLNNPDRALHYFELAEELAEELDYTYGLIATSYNIGFINYQRENYEEAVERIQRSLELTRAYGDKHFEALDLGVMTVIAFDHYKDYDLALKYAEETLAVAEDIGNPYLIRGSLSTMASVYNSTGRHCEALEAAERAWPIDTTDLDANPNIMHNIVLANIQMGNKARAVETFERFGKILERYNDQSLHQSISDLEIKYETEKKELRIEVLEAQKRLYVWLAVAGIAILLMLFGLLFYRHRLNVNKRTMAEQRVKQLEQEKQLIATQAVLDGETAERSRLARDLHDGLGGMLSVVKLNLKDMKGYSIMDAPDVSRFQNALQMLDDSIGELRRVAHHMMPDSLMRYGLKVSLEDFCRAIPGANFQYLGEDPRLDSRLEVLIYRCAYELINNAVKHAEADSINIQLMVDGGVVSLTVQDNGKGFDPETATGGAGLENIRTRVSAYNGRMNIYSAPGNGTEISIEIESA